MYSSKNDKNKRELALNQESSYKKEIVAVALSILFIFFALAVFSYNPNDSTLFHYSSKTSVMHNWSGALGANVAALFFYLLGIAIYAFLATVLFPLYLLIRKISCEQERGRMLVAFVGVLFVAALSSIYQLSLFHEQAGGLIGLYCSRVFIFVFGSFGSQILLWGCLWIMVSILVRIPLLPLLFFCMQYLRRGLISLWSILLKPFKKKVVLFDQQTSVVAAGATKTEEFDTAFWQQLSGDSSNIPALKTEPSIDNDQKITIDHELIQRFAQRQINQISRHMSLLKIHFVFPPNSVLKHNIFATRDGMAICPYLAICNACSIVKNKTVQLPDISLFNKPSRHNEIETTQEQMSKRAQKVEEKLKHFGVNGSVSAIKPGPVVTMFEYKPEIDSKISKIISLEDDLAMALTAQSMRILAPIPGRNVIGFEIANEERASVSMADIVTTPLFEQTTAALPIVLGVDIAGNPVIVDMVSMPHLLVGGATGSGKSVGMNVMLLSLLCKLTPDQLKLILIDPKRLEFTPYADIPHLLFPIVTQPTRASAVLGWVVQEMEERYEAMAAAGVRNIHDYRKVIEHQEGEHKQMPYLVIMIDELADLMMVAGKEVETHIVRIAQMARASGIHLIVATQRPSVDVVTGLIKVNFPSRVAFRVSSKVDSRTILDMQGAEKLLGKGDMLFMHASSPELKRVHGAYVSDQEIERVTDFLRSQQTVQYLDLNEVLVRNAQAQNNDWQDDLYDQVREFIKTTDEISISMLQRHYRIGFNRSARLIEKLELDGLIAPAQGSKPRKVLR